MPGADRFQGHGGWFLRRDALPLLLLTFAVLLLFMQARGFGYVNLDDPVYLVDNPEVNRGLSVKGLYWALTGSAGGLWLPVTWISYQAVITLLGPGPGPQHIVNIVLHALNAMLLYLLLRRATGDALHSALAALLFAIHPTRVESVVWIAERKDVLSTFFGLLACAFHLQYLEGGRSLVRWLRGAAFLLGLMSKAMLVTLPVLLVLADIWPLRRCSIGSSWKDLARSLREKSDLIGLAVLFSLATLGTQHAAGAVATFASHPAGLRLFNVLRSTVQYLGALVWPVDLAVFYPYIGLGGWGLARTMVALALLTGITWVACKARRRLPFLLTGWLGFLVALLPVSGLIQAGSQARADRFTYVPFIGLFVIIAWGWAELGEYLRIRRSVGHLIAGLACVALGFQTWNQVRLWRDDITLFEHAARVTSQNHLAHAQAGLALLRAEKPQRAAYHLFEAARILPDNANYSYMLGIAQGRLGEWNASLRSLERARALGAAYPYLDFHHGLALLQNGRLREAIPHLEAFLQDSRRRPPADPNHDALVSQARAGLDFARSHLGRY